MSETPVYLPSGSEHISGVCSVPEAGTGTLGVLLLHAGYMNFSANRNRVWARTARTLSSEGCLVLRLDFHGSGDSSGSLDDRASRQSLADVLAGVDLLRRLGAERVVLVGVCFGAQMSLIAAADLPDLAALCLLSPPLQRLRKRPTGVLPQQKVGVRKSITLLQPRVLTLIVRDAEYRAWLAERVWRRVSRTRKPPRSVVAAPAADRLPLPAQPTDIVRDVAARGVPIHVLYGEQDRPYQEILDAGDESVLGLVGDALTTLRVIPDPVHTLASLAAQECAFEFVRDCVTAVAAEVAASQS